MYMNTVRERDRLNKRNEKKTSSGGVRDTEEDRERVRERGKWQSDTARHTSKILYTHKRITPPKSQPYSPRMTH